MGLTTRYLIVFDNYGRFCKAPSDEKTRLSFVHAAGPRERSLMGPSPFGLMTTFYFFTFERYLLD
jgi:hypothetical protein